MNLSSLTRNSKSQIAVNLLLLILMMAFIVALAVQNYRLHTTNATLQETVRQLKDKNNDEDVVKAISKQLEEIAYQQKDVSDIQREEAEQQTRIAQSLRLQAESEQHRAQQSEQMAIVALSQAHNDRRIADQQRQIAENEREAALRAKDEATRFRLSLLGKNLGTMAVNQFRAGKKDLAQALAYASWFFTSENGGNTFTPEVFEALSLVSGGTVTTKDHRAAVSSISTYPIDDSTTAVISCGRYGEIVEARVSNADNATISRRMLFSDKAFDFRDIFIDNRHVIYALSFDGRVVSVSPSGESTIFPIPPAEIPKRDANRAENIGLNLTALGNSKGEIVLRNSKTGEERLLVAHSSAITGLAFSGSSLFSCSLDGTLRIWDVSSSAITPVTLLNKGTWIYNMARSRDGQTLWIAAGDGTVTAVFTNPNKLAARLKKQMRRDLTRGEWREYVGEDVPYIRFI